MLLEVIFCLVYGILAYCATFVVIYEGWPTRMLTGLSAYFIIGNGEEPTSNGPSGKGSKGPFVGRNTIKPKKGGNNDDDWNEEASQIMRYKIVEDQIVKREFFDQYNQSVMFFLVAVFVIFGRLLAEPLLKGDPVRSALAHTDIAVLVVGTVCISRLVNWLVKVQYDPKTTQSIDFSLGVFAGLLTSVIVAGLLFSPYSSRLDFDIQGSAVAFLKEGPVGSRNVSKIELKVPDWWYGLRGLPKPEEPKAGEQQTEAPNLEAMTAQAGEKNSDKPETESGQESKESKQPSERTAATIATTAKLFVCAFAGMMSLLFMPATVRVVRSYNYLSTPFQWTVGTIEYNRVDHAFCSLALALPAIASVLWFKPMAGVLLFSSAPSSTEQQTFTCAAGTGEECEWSQYGLSAQVVNIIRHSVLFAANVLPLFLLRPNLQAHLDSAYMFWYQQLHGPVGGSNPVWLAQKMQMAWYFFCKVAMQCLVPQFLGLLLLLLSWALGLMSVHRLPLLRLSSDLLGVVMLMCSWVSTTVWAVQSLTFLMAYRLGQVR